EQDTILFKNLGKVLEASHRGQELVVRILDFGRRHQRYEQKPFPINTIIENVLSLLRPTIPSSVRIELIDPVDCIILGNETQHHGEVGVTSQLGVGTTFTLLLPEYQEALNSKENTNGNYSFSGR